MFVKWIEMDTEEKKRRRKKKIKTIELLLDAPQSESHFELRIIFQF